MVISLNNKMKNHLDKLPDDIYINIIKNTFLPYLYEIKNSSLEYNINKNCYQLVYVIYDGGWNVIDLKKVNN